MCFSFTSVEHANIKLINAVNKNQKIEIFTIFIKKKDFPYDFFYYSFFYFYKMRFFLKLILIITLSTLINQLWSQSLSDQAEISILSFGPGEAVYDLWGHTAIRINDPVRQLDKVYNYGTYDFKASNFLMKFLRGKLDYALSIQRYRSVVRAYKRENRWIKEQILALTNDEKEKLYWALEQNYLPENRLYKYDFFFDNCATRPQQIIENNLDRDLQFLATDEISFRDILDEQLYNTPWTDFGIDLIIGAKADQLADERQQMFMPIYFYDNIASAEFEDTNEDIVKNELVIYESRAHERNTFPFIMTPFFLMILLLIFEVVIFIQSIRKKKLIFKFYDQFWFILIFIASLVISFMWFATDHLATKENWNLIWINPLFFFLLFPKKIKLKHWTSILLFILILLTVIFWSVIPQAYHIAFLPMMFILLLKLYKYAFLKY